LGLILASMEGWTDHRGIFQCFTSMKH
jgi:hypothetical protein